MNATSEELWEAVGDVEGFPKSHPTITSFTGVAEVGIRMEFRNEEGGSSISFKPTVLAADPGRELRWLGHVAFSGLMDGNHAFLLEPVAGGTKVTQTESFTGILGIFALLMMDLGASIEASNQALANFVETKIQ
nr:SRPBCC domain-containing protein [Corynebacterium deserti]